MAEGAVEVVRAWMGRLEHGDPAPELCDPEVEIVNVAEFPITGPYHGRDGVQRWWEDLAEAFETLRLSLISVEPADGRSVLTIQSMVGKFRLTGIEVDVPWGAVVSVKDGRIIRAVGYGSPDQARAAAGLDSGA